MSAIEAGAEFELDAAWRLSAMVALREERFGGIAYHYGNRTLSCLSDPTLVTVLRDLELRPSARAACEAAGVATPRLPAFGRALAALAGSAMIERR